MKTETTTLTEDQRNALNQYRQATQRQLEAHMRADRETARRLQAVFAHFEDNNYGLAEDHIRELLEDMRHDHGAQEFHPMLDRHLEAMQERG